MTTITVGQIIAQARRRTGKTAAEFDYSLTQRPSAALAAIADTCYELANDGYAEITLASTTEERQARHDRVAALREQIQPQIQDLIEAAKAKSYTGWSSASRGPIRYAR